MDAAPTPGGGGAAAILTGGASVEVVVILGDVRQDAEAVGDLKSHHVFCIQQGRNSQLLLRNPEGLEMRKTHVRPRSGGKNKKKFHQLIQPNPGRIRPCDRSTR